MTLSQVSTRDGRRTTQAKTDRHRESVLDLPPLLNEARVGGVGQKIEKTGEVCLWPPALAKMAQATLSVTVFRKLTITAPVALQG